MKRNESQEHQCFLMEWSDVGPHHVQFLKKKSVTSSRNKKLTQLNMVKHPRQESTVTTRVLPKLQYLSTHEEGHDSFQADAKK